MVTTMCRLFLCLTPALLVLLEITQRGRSYSQCVSVNSLCIPASNRICVEHTYSFMEYNDNTVEKTKYTYHALLLELLNE